MLLSVTLLCTSIWTHHFDFSILLYHSRLRLADIQPPSKHPHLHPHTKQILQLHLRNVIAYILIMHQIPIRISRLIITHPLGHIRLHHTSQSSTHKQYTIINSYDSPTEPLSNSHESSASTAPAKPTASPNPNSPNSRNQTSGSSGTAPAPPITVVSSPKAYVSHHPKLHSMAMPLARASTSPTSLVNPRSIVNRA